MKKIIFINSHPIQYFAPLYQYMNKKGVQTSAWYCSDDSIKGRIDAEFGVKIKWDVPVLDGYDYKFFKNYSWKPSHFKGFFGLINFGVCRALLTAPKSVFVVHGYHYFTHLLILILARLRGHTVCLRMEMPLMHEKLKKGWKSTLRKLLLKYIVFSPVHYFLYIGSQNRLFYKSYGIPDKKLIFCPYSVDNERFANERTLLIPKVPAIKATLGIPADHKVVLYSGKYVDKKNPMDLLKAFKKMNRPDCWLIMLGEGKLRSEMEAYVETHKLRQVLLTGFVNQSKISEYYAISDAFVMASSVGETWGLSVNEALNFELPVIVSDLTGCGPDLVKDGVNGCIFQTGNVSDLASKLEKVLTDNTSLEKGSVQQLVSMYSYASITTNLRTLAD